MRWLLHSGDDGKKHKCDAIAQIHVHLLICFNFLQLPLRRSLQNMDFIGRTSISLYSWIPSSIAAVSWSPTTGIAPAKALVPSRSEEVVPPLMTDVFE